MIEKKIDIGKIDGLIITFNNMNEKIVDKWTREFDKLPEFWKERLRRDKWKYLLIDSKTMEEYKCEVVRYQINGDSRVIILNLDYYETNKNMLLKAFYLYISRVYGMIEKSSYFIENYKEEKDLLIEKLNLEKDVDICKVARELFAYQVNNPTDVIKSKCYEYMKTLLDGTIFNVNTFNTPDFLYIGAGVMQYQVDKILEQIKVLPWQYLADFIAFNWIIILTNESRWKIEMATKNKNAYVIPRIGEMYINSVTLDEIDALYHEFGHFIQIEEERKRRYKYEFEEIYEKEKNEFLKIQNLQYCIKNVTEYFAQSVCYYLSKRKQLKQYTPLTYEYIDKMMIEKEEETIAKQQIAKYLKESSKES